MLIISVVGARPQFVKASPVSRALGHLGVHELIVHTGQHYDAAMSESFFADMDIPEPFINLGVGSGTHGSQTGKMLAGLESAFIEHAPTWVLVYGDTNSTMAAALAASKLHIPVAHVEAGLRSFNRMMPEEINRIVTDVVSTALFTPTSSASNQLRAEGIPEHRIENVGDVMYDAALTFSEHASSSRDTLTQLGLRAGSFVIATIHRAENTDNDDRLAAIAKGLVMASREFAIVLPLHPRTRARLETLGLLAQLERSIQVVGPVGYLDMLNLERSAAAVVTDSGGVQKEAFFFRTPCLTLRAETEWTELIDSGWNRLCPSSDPASIAVEIMAAPGRTGSDVRPYGDGNAASKVAAALLRGPEAFDSSTPASQGS